MPRSTIELQRDPFGAPIAGSFALHLAIAGAIALSIYLSGRFHGIEWGNDKAPGAIQATLVSAAPTLPLPQDTPPTPNVLATQTPSPAPAPPAPKEIEMPEPKAIPIPTKAPPKVKLQKEKPAVASPPHAQPVPNQQHRANYGEAQASQIPHATNSNPGQTNPVNVNGGDFGSRFPWYVALITRKVNDNWYRQEIDPGTPFGRQVRVIFTISRDGSPSGIHISQSSGSSSLDSSALRAVERVETFGPLPSQYSGGNVSVEYTFSYDQPAR